ncbi:MAG TPA: hypothetical protein VK428_11760, partial [Acidimicrobiales bacterium]|nr:hypothetical protein [Acidimicrobiales bacterium]
ALCIQRGGRPVRASDSGVSGMAVPRLAHDPLALLAVHLRFSDFHPGHRRATYRRVVSAEYIFHTWRMHGRKKQTSGGPTPALI